MTVSLPSPVTLSLMDGLVGMQGRGPINGYPINLNVLLASRDPVALDATGMRLIGLDPHTSRHIVHACDIGLGQVEESAISVDGPFAVAHVLFASVSAVISYWQVELQPSPLIVLLSSHSSGASTLPSPHTGPTTGAPAVPAPPLVPPTPPLEAPPDAVPPLPDLPPP